jgi:hypothetical protein
MGESVQDLPQGVLVGLAVTSHDNAVVNASVFDNVSIVRDAWSQGDIGSVLNAGGASGHGTVEMRGDGADIWGAADAFFFRHRKLSGDGEIRARVTSVQNTNAWAKAGVMIREGLEPGSRHASTFVTPTSGVAFQRREAANGVSLHTGAVGSAPRWVRIVRTGNLFTSYASADGSAWTEVGRSTIAMGSEAHVGLAVTSHRNGTPNTSTFDRITVTD